MSALLPISRTKRIQLEKSIRDLQHQYMRVVVLVTDQYALTCPPHAVLVVMLLEPLQSREHGGIFFWLAILGAKGVVAERV